jgi:prepilin-type N-terminal cleavage/methylation domain-containing protein/prepilin-type processing-associated H-X9-DG protein
VKARRRKGFTLIELLVVIAIIGILAAMLFPVFARARESARKIQCLSNVKNIALAYQMYLTDYDRLNPSEHRAEIIDYFNGGQGSGLGCGCGGGRQCCTDRIAQANPYLKLPVILDEYIKNRDVWKCPSAPTQQTFEILDPYLNSTGRDDWWLRFKESQDGCPRFRSCSSPFPTGWGGPVTDTQQGGVWCTPDIGTGGFEMSIGVVLTYDMSTSGINDPAKFVVCGDGGVNHGTGMDDATELAYPDTCRLRSIACSSGCGGDWDNCSQSRDCSPPRADSDKWKWGTDPNIRKTLAKARHMGGDNLGFADGHAKWMPAESILFGGQTNWRGYGSGELEGVTTCIYPGPVTY